MIEAYNKISLIWKTFPFQLEGTPIYQKCQHLKVEFERKRMLFDDYCIKIVIIGNLSTGKSTLINTLIERDIFGTFAGHGTDSFFYCSKTNKSYEYFTINGLHEIKAVDVLQDARELNHKLDEFIDVNCIIKVYINDNNDEIFKYKTIIVDCPGLGKNENYDSLIKEHCSKANLFLFLFDIEVHATLKQKEYIEEILNNFKNPSCFFIFNKCDKIPFDHDMINKIKTQFYDGFHSEYVTDLKISGEPLYFISARTELNKIMSSNDPQTIDSFYTNEFVRLKSDIMNLKSSSYLRLQTDLVYLLMKLNNYAKSIDDLLNTVECNRKCEAMYQYNQLNAIKIHYSNIKETLDNANKDSVNKLKEKDFCQFIIDEINKYEESCSKTDNFVIMLGNKIDNKIRAFLQTHINKFWYSQIKILLENELLKNKFKDRNFQISVVSKLVPVYMDTSESTENVKDKFEEFVKSKSKEIRETIIGFYEQQLENFSNSISSTIDNVQNDKFYLNSDNRNVPIANDDLITHLKDYKKDVLKYKTAYQAYLSK